MNYLFRLIIFISVLLFACSCKDDAPKQTAKPNIKFYLADDQNIEDYGCYRNDKIQTPAVDRLAKEGMLFKKAFTAQAICAHSRSQLFTGNYPFKNGCFMNHSSTKPDIKSVTIQL